MTPFRKELDYFLTLCETLNISEAAERIGIQQAGLSKALKSLEQFFDQALFYRSNRGLKLTPYGQVVRNNLITVSDLWHNSFELAVEQLAQMSGQFKIGAHPTVAINTMPKLFPLLCEQYPNLKLQLVLKRSPEITKLVLEHELDLGIVANPIQHPDLVIIPLIKEFVACWSKDDSKQALNKKSVLYYNPEMIEIVSTLKKYKKLKQIAISDYEVIAAFANHSAGISILPDPVARRHKNLKQIGNRLMEVSICLIYRYDHLKTKTFSELLAKTRTALVSAN